MIKRYSPLHNAWCFFRENIGGIVGYRAQGALELARAEAIAESRQAEDRWRYTWEADEYPDTSWCDKRDLELLQNDLAGFDNCTLQERCSKCGTWRTIESLCGIHWINRNETDRRHMRDYRRVVQAELADEALRQERN